MAILQGSEVAYVERALVRAPAAFLGFEARKEGHHLRSCKPGICLAFCFAAHTATAPRCHPETIQRAQKQKIGSGCNFFSIADCRVTKKRRSWPKNAVKKLQNGPFSALREWRRVPNRKKVAETSGFLFLRWAAIAVTWQPREKYAESAAMATATATVQAEEQTPI